MFPSAEVVVHEKGARHLADPSRLMASARMVYGDALDVLFGELAPVPADRLRTLDDTGQVDLGDGRRLESYYSPGHARHHVGLLDSASGDLYVGDAAGVYIPETGDLRPATPPPDFDLDVALASLGRFAALDPQRLLFSHYGPVADVPATLERSAEEISVWVSETRAARSAGMDLDHAVEAVRQKTLSRYAASPGRRGPGRAPRSSTRSAGAAGQRQRHLALAGQAGPAAGEGRAGVTPAARPPRPGRRRGRHRAGSAASSGSSSSSSRSSSSTGSRTSSSASSASPAGGRGRGGRLRLAVRGAVSGFGSAGSAGLAAVVVLRRRPRRRPRRPLRRRGRLARSSSSSLSSSSMLVVEVVVARRRGQRLVVVLVVARRLVVLVVEVSLAVGLVQLVVEVRRRRTRRPRRRRRLPGRRR